MKKVFNSICNFFRIVFEGIVEGRARRAKLNLAYRMRNY